MEEKLYHVSHVPNLTLLQPKVSTHGKSYVYATKNLTVALLFGSNKSMGDLDGAYGGGSDGVKPYFYEAFEGAFKRRFENVTCYIYEIDPTNFLENQTSYKSELVSSEPVKILSSTKVENLYDTLIGLSKVGKLDLRFYDKDNPEYVEFMKKHLKHRIKLFGILDNKDGIQYEFCQKHHSQILKELEEEK